ncbi:spherulin-1A [Rhizodiscina lignyota]|uniref:Spherulin-1A n=1 Tax=Rhizodiscina lignyota TaxID=1504668 RepID=A0A9P4IPR8_9PEZI|nr:spherulin-1A [Rhizodiscina lignyota]
MHFSTIAALLSLSGAVLAAPLNTNQTVDAPEGPAESNSTANNLDLITKLENAATAVDRFALLNDGSDWKFDFNAPPGGITKGKGGMTVRSDRKLFPALIGTGVSMTVGFLGPCGFNTPHTHPRSSEINIVIEGRLGTNFIGENGGPLITNTLDKLQMTVFPQGALHTEFNPDCDSAIFVAGFASEDPGVQQVAQTLFSVQESVLSADLGLQGTDSINGQDIEAFKDKLPANVALGVESCLAKCHIKKN